MDCEVSPALSNLREKTKHANWLIVSGGDQAELREIFAIRQLEALFDGGIFGSPDNKDEILERELANKNIKLPALFLGDSKYDFQAATKANLDFVFLSAWSEVWDSDVWCQKFCITSVSDLSALSI